MTTDLIVLITAVIGLITALLTFWAVKQGGSRPTDSVVEPPVDPEDANYVETTIWERTPIKRPEFNSGPTVLSVVAMKGGVGKTTVAANLAAYFSRRKKVLLIDFDYQSNLSVTVMNQLGITDVKMTAHKLIIAKEDPSITILRAPPNQMRRQDAGRISIFTAHYSLATVENQLMADWLSAAAEAPDVRFNLLRYLRSEAFKQFDLVIIDCPPRLTTATVNALTASTHVLIPTLLDNLSAPAASYFARQLARMRPSLFPHLKLVGVVPSITVKSTGLNDREAKVANDIEAEMTDIWPASGRPAGKSVVMGTQFIPRTGPIGDAAGLGIAFFRNNGAQSIFSRLGAEVEERLLS
jgi:cellulose biosynthesis protein BcsQ